MFRHPSNNIRNGSSKENSLEDKINQSIRYFKVPATKEKSDVLNFLLNEINKKQESKKTENKIRRIYFTVGSVAAAACVLLFVLYSFFAFETYSVNEQSAAVYFLPDHSRVILTKGSEIKFSKINFDRKVKLKGEAYFEVKHGNHFYVDTKNGGVMVLGTRFKVKDFNKQLIVQCYEGTVGVDYSKDKVKIDKGFYLEGANNKITVSENLNFGYPDFAAFNYNFNNVSLNEIWPVVEDFFGVKIQESLNLEKAFTGSFFTGSVEEVLEIICTPMNLNYQIKDNKIIITERI